MAGIRQKTGSKRVVSEQEFEVLREFLFVSEPDYHYPIIQENERLFYVLAGMVVRQLLQKRNGRFSLRGIHEFINIQSLEMYKKRLWYLLNNSIHLIDVQHTTPIAKSLYVLFMTDMRCLRNDWELMQCYTIGLFTDHIQIL